MNDFVQHTIPSTSTSVQCPPSTPCVAGVGFQSLEAYLVSRDADCTRLMCSPARHQAHCTRSPSSAGPGIFTPSLRQPRLQASAHHQTSLPYPAFQPDFFLSAPSFFSFLSLLPPLSNSKCPAFCASSFSVWPTSPELLLCLILFCLIIDAFLGLMTRVPRWMRWADDLDRVC
jgi:hypothetical protein